MLGSRMPPIAAFARILAGIRYRASCLPYGGSVGLRWVQLTDRLLETPDRDGRLLFDLRSVVTRESRQL